MFESGEWRKVSSYIECLSYDEKKGSRHRQGPGSRPFITISRQSGAGGNLLAAEILRKLSEHKGELYQGWRKYNQELCRAVSLEPDVHICPELFEKMEYRSELEDMLEEWIVRATPQDQVNKKIFSLLDTLSAEGKVILVGRGGVCVTRRLPLGIHVRLVAPLADRVKRMREHLGVSEKKAAEIVAEQDRGRAKFLKNYFNKNIDDPLLYDAVLNSSTLGFEAMADMLIRMIEVKVLLNSEYVPAHSGAGEVQSLGE